MTQNREVNSRPHRSRRRVVTRARGGIGVGMLVVGLTVIIGVSACSSNSSASDSSATEQPAPSDVTLPVTAVTVVVMQPGAQPQLAATYQPSSATQRAVLTTSSQVTQQINEQPPQDFSTPRIDMPLDATAAGNEQVDLTLGTVTAADPDLSAALKPEQGSRAGLNRAQSGAISGLRIQPAEAAQDIARSAVEQSLNQAVYRAVAFPDTAIGVGAVWTITQQVMSGISLTQVTTATLTARSGNRVTVDVTVNQTPNSPVWELPGEAGELNVDSYVMRGGGSVVLDLGSPLPISGDITVAGDQAYSDPSSSTQLRQTISTRVQWRES